MFFGKKTPASKTDEELDDIEREEFVLRKNMMHDEHRLAYILARRAHLTGVNKHGTPTIASIGTRKGAAA